MKNRFNVIISSDDPYNELCAEIYFNNDFIAIITQERGIENALIEMVSPKGGENWSFGYLEFIEILKDAHTTLLSLNSSR